MGDRKPSQRRPYPSLGARSEHRQKVRSSRQRGWIQRLEQALLADGAGQLEVLVRAIRRDAPARSARQEALLDQVGLVDVLQRIARLAERRGQGLDAHRTALVKLDDDVEEAP